MWLASLLCAALLWEGLAAAGCPDKCVCRASSVDCSNRGLTTIPADIPRDTVKL